MIFMDEGRMLTDKDWDKLTKMIEKAHRHRLPAWLCKAISWVFPKFCRRHSPSERYRLGYDYRGRGE